MAPQLTIEEMRAQAAAGFAEHQQAAKLDAPAYPQPEPEPARPTLAERWAEFWRNIRIKQLRQQIQREQQLIDGMPDAIEQARAEAYEAHYLTLKEIDSLADFHTAEARREIFKAQAKLLRLGARP